MLYFSILNVNVVSLTYITMSNFDVGFAISLIKTINSNSSKTEPWEMSPITL